MRRLPLPLLEPGNRLRKPRQSAILLEREATVGKDITPNLAGWDFDPDETQVRIVPGDDGRDKLQMRVDLGLLQMEMAGRPDGQRPHGHESLLDYYETCARNLEATAPDGLSEQQRPRLALDPRSCAALMREGLQYYHRYVALFHLQRYDLVARDTARNLRLFAFVVEHASRAHDKLQFDQYRPYVTLMQARALGSQSLAHDDHLAALEHIDAGIAGIRAFLREYDQAEREPQCAELGFLLNWRTEVERNRPLGPVERLQQQLHLAVATERFEEAARLRDQILRLQGTDVPGRR